MAEAQVPLDRQLRTLENTTRYSFIFLSLCLFSVYLNYSLCLLVTVYFVYVLLYVAHWRYC